VKVGYFGDGPWAHNALLRLLNEGSVEVAFVCARYGKPDPVLKSIAQNAGKDFIVTPDINSTRFLRTITEYQCDLLVSMSYNQIFKQPLISMAPLGVINCHAGKLPFYRGRNILNWVLINDESEFGITVHYIDKGIDTGDIILQRSYPIGENDDYSTLLIRAYEGCGDLLHQAIVQIVQGTAKRTPQGSIHVTGSYCTSRRSGDEILDWNQESREVFNFVRALCRPGPEARTFLGEVEIMINRVSIVEEAPLFKGIPGAVIGVNGNSYLVKTRDSFVRVEDLTTPVNIKVGDRFS
jgi:methionyl-tRNA formyltransferase